MSMQSHEWVPVQQANERIKDFHRQAEAERLIKIAKANQSEAERISFQRVLGYMVSLFKRMMQPKLTQPAPQRKVLVRNHRRTA